MNRLEVSATSVAKATQILDARLEQSSLVCFDVSSLVVLVRRIPKLREFRFERRKGLWYAEKGGIAAAIYANHCTRGGWSNHKDCTIITKRGRIIPVENAWHPFDHVVNYAGFGPCIGVHLTSSPEQYRKPTIDWHQDLPVIPRETLITVGIAKLACRIAGCRLEESEETKHYYRVRA